MAYRYLSITICECTLLTIRGARSHRTSSRSISSMALSEDFTSCHLSTSTRSYVSLWLPFRAGPLRKWKAKQTSDTARSNLLSSSCPNRLRRLVDDLQSHALPSPFYIFYQALRQGAFQPRPKGCKCEDQRCTLPAAAVGSASSCAAWSMPLDLRDLSSPSCASWLIWIDSVGCSDCLELHRVDDDWSSRDAQVQWLQALPNQIQWNFHNATGPITTCSSLRKRWISGGCKGCLRVGTSSPHPKWKKPRNTKQGMRRAKSKHVNK